MHSFLRSTIGTSLLVALASWLIGFGDLIDHGYWNNLYKVVRQPADQEIVLVTLDEMKGFGSAQEAAVLDRLRLMMPREVYFDAKIQTGADKAADVALARAVMSYGRDLTFVVRQQKLDDFTVGTFQFPPRAISGDAPIALSAWNSNFIYTILSAPVSVTVAGQSYPTLSTRLAHLSRLNASAYYPDYSLDPATIPKLSGQQLLDGLVPTSAITGRTVIVTSLGQAPMAGYFGSEMVPTPFHDIAGARALHRSFSIDLTALPLLLFTVLLLTLIARIEAYRFKIPAYAMLVAMVMVLPATVRVQGVVLGPGVSVLALLCFGSLRIWQKRTRRIQHTNVSGLPNLLALSNSELGVGRDVVVAVIARYEEMLATLPAALHGEYARQIARRIAIGTSAQTIYHGDGGHFAWSEEARPLEMQFGHLEGLRALFSAPLQIGHLTFDTNIHFGLDRNEGLDALTRVNSALASANEALGNGRAIELFEAHRLAEAPWELSLHARIDEGLRNGDIWLAFQPQWRLDKQEIYGAEALIRWNHPMRGPITPDAFILQAERAGRIDALTYWVLEEAITAALTMNALDSDFQISVNLSAQMVDKADLVANFAEIVGRRGISPRLLTIEVTETSSVRNRPVACQNLTQLRDMGFRLSIDDFGTGEASLAYLADLPSDELKLDRRFVSRIVSSHRDRAIVSNTIDLAHALGQHVVAEGIEDLATLNLLRELGCDFAQGYYLGRPQPFAAFREAYEESRSLRQTRSI
jgi:EAL domain-containing protein (putative c-di-GMP-specific phosphodiesterase class I)